MAASKAEIAWQKGLAEESNQVMVAGIIEKRENPKQREAPFQVTPQGHAASDQACLLVAHSGKSSSID